MLEVLVPQRVENVRRQELEARLQILIRLSEYLYASSKYKTIILTSRESSLITSHFKNYFLRRDILLRTFLARELKKGEVEIAS